MIEQIGRLIQAGLERLRNALIPGNRQSPAPVPIPADTPPRRR